MRLSDLCQYDRITIQCHDNPDADALASGYGLYCYFKSRGREVRLVYSGWNRIQKSNLRLMVDKLKLPVEYISVARGDCYHAEGLLITVDCQFGAGNVTGISGDATAVIDHHQIEKELPEWHVVNSNLGSCSTLVWKLLREEDFVIDENLGTALYYGLYTDTNQFSELYNPLDMDMREAVKADKSLITLFRNANLSLEELEIAGVAMIRYSYNNDYEFAVVKAQPCDPNILGLISDFLLQVDVIKTCVVYNEAGEGYKFSVRSCVKEVNASELAAFLAEGIGSGGGHYEKAGGFISKERYRNRYPGLHPEGYFNNRMALYFESFELIYAQEYAVDLSIMEQYVKKKIPVGYVKAAQVLPVGTPITIRALEGDLDMTVEEDLYIIIGIKGEVYPNREDNFKKFYHVLDRKYDISERLGEAEYEPVIKDRNSGQDRVLTDYAGMCVPVGETPVYARVLEKGVKIFTQWDKSKYMTGRPGDYLVARRENLHDIYVVEKDIFAKSYDRACHGAV